MRLGFVTSSVVAWGIVLLANMMSRLRCEEWQRGYERFLGRPFAQIVPRVTRMLEYELELAEESKTLAVEVGR